MTLYEEFLKTIQATQDKNIIIDNLLKGVQYIFFKIEPINNTINTDNNLLKISIGKRVSGYIPSFAYNKIYLPYHGLDMDYILSYYTEFLLCHINEITDRYIQIDITQSLNNFQKNNTPFNSHQVKLIEIKNQKKLNFIQNYQSISEYLKETLIVPKKKNYAYILQFNYKYLIDPFLELIPVEPENFECYDFLFFSEKEELIKENSNLIFKDSTNSMLIDIEKTIEKIEFFNSMKNF